MNEATYRLAARIAAVSRPLRGRPVPAQQPVRALVARWQALRQLAMGLGVVAMPRAVRRAAAGQAAIAGIAGYRGGGSAPSAGPATLRRPAFARPAAAERLLPILGRQLVGAKRRAVVDARNAVAAPVAPPRLALVLARGAGGSVGAKSTLIAQPGPRLAVATRAMAATPQRLAAMAAPGGSARVRHPIVAPVAQQAVTPGFHRTVRQPQSKAAAGDVYLDKTLVGYHLAAAITAEQTRAAARPNASGASFNSSMAALRPTGAGT